MRCTLFLLAILALSPQLASAQEPPLVSPRSVTFGFGVPYGTLGASLEHELRTSPWSLSVGFGVWPIEEEGATATVWNPGASVKRFRGEGKHQLFAVLGLGVVKMRYRLVEQALRNLEIEDIERRWGAAPGVGYRYRAHNGFTTSLSANVPVTFEGETGSIYPELGLGYTW